MNRFLLFIILLTNHFISFSQNNSPIISIPEYNFLYIGFPNKVNFGTNNGISSYKVVIENARLETKVSEMSKDDSTYQLVETFLYPTSVSEDVKITFIDTITNKVLGVHFIKTKGIPSPNLYLGSLSSGMWVGKSSLKAMTRLFVKYPPEFPLIAEFSVITWEISNSNIPGITCSGSGAKLTEEAIEFLNIAPKGSKLCITVKYKGMGISGFNSSVILILE
ncbi:MAG: hypothetical protein HYR91_05160 [Flavobacteriia bacterium]|nr:hypothetical protein [Flavobacteriia bacterium]